MHTVHLEHADFACWRARARRLLSARLPPSQVLWQDNGGECDLFANADPSTDPAPFENYEDPGGEPLAPRLSARDLKRLENASRYRTDPQQESGWALLYRIVWRLALGERAALLPGDPDGAMLEQRIKAVSHEAHHMHAFLRFHCRYHDDVTACGPQFIAWFEPRHEVLEEAAQHFIGRMGHHPWLILTPEGAIICDGQKWKIERPDTPYCHTDYQRLRTGEDESETLWLAYYASTFNPVRVNEHSMRRSMPARFWRHLPEQALITSLTGNARRGGRQVGQDSRLIGRPGHVIAPTVSRKRNDTPGDSD